MSIQNSFAYNAVADMMFQFNNLKQDNMSCKDFLLNYNKNKSDKIVRKLLSFVSVIDKKKMFDHNQLSGILLGQNNNLFNYCKKHPDSIMGLALIDSMMKNADKVMPNGKAKKLFNDFRKEYYDPISGELTDLTEAIKNNDDYQNARTTVNNGNIAKNYSGSNIAPLASNTQSNSQRSSYNNKRSYNKSKNSNSKDNQVIIID
ncbi:MAG: hypothetical protein OEY79_03890 [Anaplasmataceae bacterium]|nr:hypothetical protein [Anaplasmataceae bacterium]